MRDRLIELLSGKSIDTYADIEYVADHLLANNVVVANPIENDYCGYTCNYMADIVNRQKAEIERLDGEVEAMKKSMWPMIANVVEGQIADAMDFAKAEAIKEVFEKLEERLFVHSFKTKSDDYTQGQVDCMDFVDSKIEELKKELVGDSDG